MVSVKIRPRDTAFEIMRLLAMIMIVLEHGLLATVLHTYPPLSVIDNLGWFVEAFTICAVNLFLLLTGYFLKPGNFRASRLSAIWIRTIFYSLSIYLIAAMMGVECINIGQLIAYACPVIFKRYWFMQTYIALALVSPFIATLLEYLNEKRHCTLCVVLLLFFSLHQTFIPIARTLDTTQGYGFVWGASLMIVGNYLRKYGEQYIEKIKLKWWIIGYVITACGIFISNCLIVKFNIAQGVTSRGNFYTYNSISVFIESVCLFCAFIKLSKALHMSCNRFVNRLSASALAVYLISAHPVLLVSLWTEIFKVQRFCEQPILYLVVLVSLALIIVMISILIDKIVIFVGNVLRLSRLIKRLDETRIDNVFN